MTLQDNTHLKILRDAAKGRYGVIASTSYTVEHMLGLIKAAERRRSPLIIQLFPWSVKFSDGVLVHAAAQAAKQARVPVSVHLDHCQSPELVKQACELPFDSIMVDMSHFDKSENLSKTKELVEYCHARGKATEAEPGRIEGGEDGISDTADLSGAMTTEGEVHDFAASGVDCIAPAFGNVHGKYGRRGVVLEWDRESLEMVRGISSKKNLFLALHGVDHFPDELLQRLVASGISKVNINKDVMVPYYEHLEKNANKIPFTQLLEDGVEAVAKAAEHLMDVIGSSGKV
ncbi:hypothetical protein QQS21_011982 [Conoideocrella luteorostrata]|uniref:Fructose-bisphosphate aldolase n=1 Tax=Conoideocrella luteorostrata TaxID=1105319 RepID=A0AAJ0FSV2_9HYPO|nr:hypothetical protein QQS21_011982 [Conoideocrella luteorostrata]